jgi:hypothetical protein
MEGKGAFQNGGENLRRSHRAQKKLIFGGGAKPHRQKSIKERCLYDDHLAFASKLKRTRRKEGLQTDEGRSFLKFSRHPTANHLS